MASEPARDVGGRRSIHAPRVVVIGGGVSGLAAAFTVSRARSETLPGLEVVVLEPRPDVGGRARSEVADGWLAEAGPSGYLDADASVAELVDAVGLGERVVRASRAAARRYILLDGRLHEVGPHPLRMIRSGLLSVGAVLRVPAEILVRPSRDPGEESVRDFVARRFGASIADRIARTAMLGIFAGDAERLSMDACFPEVRRLEREHGSVIRGMLGRRRRGGAGEGGPSRRLTSYLGGLQELPRALAAQPGVQVRNGVLATSIRRSAGEHPRAGFVVETRAGDALRADSVILATPVTETAALLAGVAPGSAERLRSIPVPPVTVVALGLHQEDATALPAGFGTLVARGQGLHMLGVLHEWQIYPRRAPEGHALVRVMYGGRLEPEVAGRDDADLLHLARTELREAFGVDGEPAFERVFRWPRAIPQYEVGHLEIRRHVRAELEGMPGLFVAGDALDGVSFVKTAATGIRQGKAAVAELSGDVDGGRPTT